MTHEFPVALTHCVATFVFTGKTGVDVVTGELAAEYESVDGDGARLWLYPDGRVVED
jgi:hypothetical protein